MPRRRRIAVLLFAGLGLAAAAAAGAATLTVAPASGSGRPGEVVQLTGAGFPASATVTVAVGGVLVLPAEFSTDDRGNLGPVFAALKDPLPEGRLTVTVAADKPYAFPKAYEVRPVVTLDPPVGDGKAGTTWRLNRALPPGGFRGMVFTVRGTGFPADGFVAADSIRIGKVTATHDPITIGPDGVLPTATIVVVSDLPPGRYDLVILAGKNTVTFASTYNVAPWAATDTVRQRAAVRALDAARKEIKDLVAVAGDLLATDDLKDVQNDVAGAESEIKAGNFDNADDLARQIREKLGVLEKQAAEQRRDKLKGLVDVIASGFDAMQPPGSPPNRQAGQTIAKGRKALEAAQALIAKGDFDQAKASLKESNDFLRKARSLAGVQGTQDQIRW